MAKDQTKEVKIGFKASDQMRTYHDRPTSWLHGDVRAVSPERAEYLLKTFPKSFFPANVLARELAKDEDAAAAAARAQDEKNLGGGQTSSDGNDGDFPQLPQAVSDKLSEKEVAAWKVAAEKVDAGKDLTNDEQKLMAKVDDLMAKVQGNG